MQVNWIYNKPSKIRHLTWNIEIMCRPGNNGLGCDTTKSTRVLKGSINHINPPSAVNQRKLCLNTSLLSDAWQHFSLTTNRGLSVSLLWKEEKPNPPQQLSFWCRQFMQTHRSLRLVKKSTLATPSLSTREDTFAINQAPQSYPCC